MDMRRMGFMLPLLIAAGPAAAQSVSATLMDVATPQTAASGAGGGTVINMIAAGPVASALDNASTVLSNGGVFSGAVSLMGQSANNALNVYGAPQPATAVPSFGPLLGGVGQSVALNMSAGGIASPITQTVNNLNAATGLGITPVIGGGGPLNAIAVGGYGPAVGGVWALGPQLGGNTVNSAVIAFQPGTAFNLSQTVAAGSVATLSVVNTLGGVTQSGTAQAGGLQPTAQAANTMVNAITMAGASAVNVQQLNSALPSIQTVNRILSVVAP